MKDGGSAYPVEQGQNQDGTWNQTFEPGMSLRDYFAAQALNGYLAARHDVFVGELEAASEAYAYADAMLRERDK